MKLRVKRLLRSCGRVGLILVVVALFAPVSYIQSLPYGMLLALGYVGGLTVLGVSVLQYLIKKGKL